MTYLQKIKNLYTLNENKTYGFSETEVAECEKKHSITLPAILREYYLVLGKNETVNNSFNRLLHPVTETGFSDDRHFVFYEENQGVAFWGIREIDLTLTNPTVYGNYDAINLTDEWFVDSTTTENFLLSMAFWNGVLGGLDYTANTTSPDDLQNYPLDNLEQQWTELKGITNQFLRFFTKNFSEIIALTTDHHGNVNGIYAGTNNEEMFRAIMDFMKIEWDYRTDRDE